MKKIIFIIFCIFTSYIAFSENTKQELNWNDHELTWHSYEDGMAQIIKNKKPGLLIFYADWCPACKEYSGLFTEKSVIENLKSLVLIRVNIDTNDSINQKYNFDGDYVPKTFALNNKGQVMHHFYSKEEDYAYFIPSDDHEYLSDFAKLVKLHGQ